MGQCQNTNAGMETQCNGGVCDGHGHCVGCLKDSDCAQGTNPCVTYTCEIEVCQPGNVANGTSCDGSGSCQSGTCMLGAPSSCGGQQCSKLQCCCVVDGGESCIDLGLCPNPCTMGT